MIGPFDRRGAARLGADVEVRAFCPGMGINEDPVTGSLNAGFAMWLTRNGTLPRVVRRATGHRPGPRRTRAASAPTTPVTSGSEVPAAPSCAARWTSDALSETRERLPPCPPRKDVLGRLTLVTGPEEFLGERAIAEVRAAVRSHDAEAEFSETRAAA